MNAGVVRMRSSHRFEHLGAHRYDLDHDRACPVLLVGEDNPLSVAPECALYPYPAGCAGYRFAEDIANVGTGHHLATWRTNLCSPRWSARAARERAEVLLAKDAPWKVIVMLGRKVARAFATAVDGDASAEVEPFCGAAVEPEGKLLISLPHPSGRNRIWNDLAQVHRARKTLADAAPDWYAL